MAKPQPIRASVALATELKRIKLPIRYKAFADLLAMGWKERDAWQVSGNFDPDIMESENWKAMKDVLQNNENFHNYQPAHLQHTDVGLTKKKKDKKKDDEDITDEEMAELMSKESQLKALLRKLKRGGMDDATELKVRQMIADITQAKKEKTAQEIELTHVFLPAQSKCRECSLFIKMLAEKEQEDY